MTRIVVVLPAPLGPRNPVTRPGWQAKLMSSTAVNDPYFRVRPSTVIMGPLCRRPPTAYTGHAGEASDVVRRPGAGQLDRPGEGSDGLGQRILLVVPGRD